MFFKVCQILTLLMDFHWNRPLVGLCSMKCSLECPKYLNKRKYVDYNTAHWLQLGLKMCQLKKKATKWKVHKWNNKCFYVEQSCFTIQQLYYWVLIPNQNVWLFQTIDSRPEQWLFKLSLNLRGLYSYSWERLALLQKEPHQYIKKNKSIYL